MKGPVAESGENPALDDLDGNLDFRFIKSRQLRVVPISRQPDSVSSTLSIRSVALYMNWLSDGLTGARIGSIFMGLMVS